MRLAENIAVNGDDRIRAYHAVIKSARRHRAAFLRRYRADFFLRRVALRHFVDALDIYLKVYTRRLEQLFSAR